MYIIFIFIVGGIFALGFGAEMIVRSSVNLANIYKVSGYFVGFTIVALGTSLPELASSIQAIQVVDSPGIAIGNIVGSNIANVLLILGMISFINPIIFPNNNKQKNQTLIVLIITIIVALIFYFISYSVNLDTTFFGIFLLLILFVFLFLQYKIESKETSKIQSKYNYSHFISYIILLIGLLFLYFGSKYFIIGSKMLAQYFSVPDAIIGITLVAFGTSLPELATGAAAALRKQSNLAVGTILGSNIYNIVGIFGVILILKSQGPHIFSEALIFSFNIMLIVTFIFVYKIRLGLRILNIKPFQLGKKSGIIFLLLYFIFIIYNYFIY